MTTVKLDEGTFICDGCQEECDTPALIAIGEMKWCQDCIRWTVWRVVKWAQKQTP